LVVLSFCTWGGFIWPETYEAKSTVFIQRSTMMDPLIKGVGTSSSMEERLKTLQNSLTSRNIMERVIKKLDIDTEAKTPQKLESLIDGMQKNITVTIKSGKGSTDAADLFVISYEGTSPKRVRDVVNTLVDEYIAENLGYRRSDAYGAFEFIQNQLLEYKGKLEESDKAITVFREKNPNMVPQTESAVLTRMESFQTSKIDADIKVKELMRKRDSLKSQLSGEKELTVGMVTSEGSPQARLNYLNSQLVILMTKYTDRYPEVLKTKAEIEELKRQIARAKESPPGASGFETSTMNPIYQQLREELVKTESEMESLRARSSELTRQQQQAKGVLGGLPKEQEEWSKLQRDRNVYQKIYDDLLQKLENARVSKNLELTDKVASFKIVDPATIPFFPVKPDRIKLILVGLVFGIAAGVGSTLAIEQLSPSFKNEDSVEEGLNLPVLVAIPSVISESDITVAKILNRKVLIATSAYLAIIFVVLVREVLFKYFEIRFISF
jgi:polysaccharide chain length determinant protein (PEP-CTERM system associated)